MLQLMVNRNLLAQFDLSEEQFQEELAEAFDQPDWLPPEQQLFEANKIVNGRIMHVAGENVLIDVGYKSEGVIPLNEWYDEGLDRVVPPLAGDLVEVLLEAVEDESGAIVLSYRKAKRQKE